MESTNEELATHCRLSEVFGKDHVISKGQPTKPRTQGHNSQLPKNPTVNLFGDLPQTERNLTERTDVGKKKKKWQINIQENPRHFWARAS